MRPNKNFYFPYRTISELEFHSVTIKRCVSIKKSKNLKNLWINLLIWFIKHNMVQYLNVKCTIMLFFTDITCFQPDLTEVAPLNISGKFKFHNFIVPIKSQIFKPQHLYNLVCCTYFCFYAKCLKKMGNRTLGGHSINARTRRGR